MTDQTLYYGVAQYGYREWYGLLYRWRLLPGSTVPHKDIVHHTPSQPASTNALAAIKQWMKQHQISAEYDDRL